MKKVLFPAVIILITALWLSCAKQKTTVEFDIPYSTDIAIPSMTVGNTYTFNTPSVMTNINDELSKNGTNGNLIGEVKYTQFDIAVKSPTVGQTLSFIRSVKFYIDVPTLPEQQVAYKYNQSKTAGPNGTTINDTIKPTDKSTTLHYNDPNLKGRFMETGIYFKYQIDPIYSTPPMTITVTHVVHVKGISE
ncbi:MAG TPA: hypothetical protein VN026_01620 [Bacteroidia bacterium]|jgi:hypothetical protein|nr:hypothetical protein [Bacteroidia bacterium]